MTRPTRPFRRFKKSIDLFLAIKATQATGGGGEFEGPLDSYSASLAAAYSLRRLLASYEGSAIRVRESGADAEADIGFNADGTLDTTTLLAHCGSNSGYVTKWYDQGGNAQDGAQSDTSKQPRIVNAGTVDPLGILFIKTSSCAIVVPDSATVSMAADTDFTHLSWSRYLNTTDRIWLVSKGDGGSGASEEYTFDVQDDVFNLFVGNGVTGANAETGSGRLADHWYHAICQHDKTADLIGVIVDDGTPVTASWAGGTFNNASNLVLGAYSGGAFFLDGYFNEFILWKRVLSAGEITALYALDVPTP